MVKKSLLWVSRVFGYVITTAVIVIALCAAALEFYFLPNINQYKPDITQTLSKSLGQKVSIGTISTGWEGIQPKIHIQKIEIFDAQNRVALALNDVKTTLSWWSVVLLEPRLASLSLQKPALTVRRDIAGTIYVAGISMSGPSKPEFANWLLKQSSIEINDAKVSWLDNKRNAPPLVLEHLQLSMVNSAWKAIVGQHQVNLSAIPQIGGMRPIKINASFRGKDVSKAHNWQGSIYGHLENTDLAVWKPWVDYPLPIESGQGTTTIWLDFDDGQIKSITADVELDNLKAAISNTSKSANFKTLSSRIKWRSFAQGQELEALSIKMITDNGVSVKNGRLKLTQTKLNNQPLLAGEMALDSLDLNTVQELASYLPLPANAMQTITHLNPQGKLSELKLSWKGNEQQLNAFSLKSQFTGLGISAIGHIPGFTNFSGEIDLNEQKGRIKVDANQATMDFKQALRWPIPAEKLSGEVNWKKTDDVYDVHVDNLEIDSVHISGVINADYQHRPDGNDKIDLNAKFDKANGQHAVFYYPTVMNKDTLHWLDTSILSGMGENVQVIVKGNVREFPWPSNKNGLFQVKAKIKDGVLDYGTGWPKLEGLSLDMLFQGKRMELNATKGHFWGNKLISTKATIEDLDALHPVLNIKGNLEGPILDTIRFINNSPVLEVTEGFTEGLKTAGKGKLKLDLMIPLDNADATKVKGQYTMINGTMLSDSVPELSKINGVIEFTDTGLSAKNINTWAFGGPATIDIASGANRLINVNARGNANMEAFKSMYPHPVLEKIHGKSDWQADINIKKSLVNLTVRSNLVGMAVDLPAPFQKSATEALPLKVVKTQNVDKQDILQMSYGNMLSAKMLRVEQSKGFVIERGEVAINELAQLPNQSGISVKGHLSEFDADAWIAEKSAFSANGGVQKSPMQFTQADISVGNLKVINRTFKQVKLKVSPTESGWHINTDSQDIRGNIQWQKKNSGKVIAKLKTLKIPTSSQSVAHKVETQTISQYPELDIQADEFSLGDKKLGALEVLASQSNESWNIEKLNITAPHSKLVATGLWSNWKTNPSTQMTINWSASNLGESLNELGYVNTIKNGTADISGVLKWPGSPHQFDYTHLTGNFKLDAKNGQILKIQPGVGRLFSVLSLQNIPRRLTFDFRDVFSDGFAYDDIGADVVIDQGILSSKNFKMKGATALVEIKGQTDLSKETQHLFVKVTPYVSDTVSLAALAGGPAVAAAAYVAQKLLNDPLNKLARDKYEFVGTWDNPVEVNGKTNQDSPQKEPVPEKIPGQ